jgi:hypothetical protein
MDKAGKGASLGVDIYRGGGVMDNVRLSFSEVDGVAAGTAVASVGARRRRRRRFRLGTATRSGAALHGRLQDLCGRRRRE